MLREEEILWIGRKPASGDSLPDREELLAEQVKERQREAYDKLERHAKEIENVFRLLEEVVAKGVAMRSVHFRPASDPQQRLPLELLRCAKEEAAKHIFVEIVEIAGTMDQHLLWLLRAVHLIAGSADALAKLFARLSMGAAKALRNMCEIELAILDEGQRYVVEQGCAIMAHALTTIVVGDPDQAVEQRVPTWTRVPWTGDLEPDDGDGLEEAERQAYHGRKMENPKAVFLIDFMRQMPPEDIASLTRCKRCGPEVCDFLRATMPFLHDFVADPVAPRTQLLHVFYNSPWWPSRCMPGAVSTPTRDAVVWNDSLYRQIGAAVVCEFCDFEYELRQRPEADRNCEPDAMVVLVACFLHRTCDPLLWYMRCLVSEACEAEVLRVVKPSNVHCRTIDSLTGPTAEYCHVVRHRRTVHVADQDKGLQADARRMYIAYTRGKRRTTVWLETQPTGLPGAGPRFASNAPRSFCHPLHKKVVETVHELSLTWHDISDIQYEPDRLAVALWFPREWFRPRYDKLHQVLDVAGDAWKTFPERQADSSQDQNVFGNITDFLSRVVKHSEDMYINEPLGAMRGAGIQRSRATPQNFKEIRPDLTAAADALRCNPIRHAIDLGCRLIDAIVVLRQGKTALQIALPCLCCRPLEDVNYLKPFADGAVLDGEPMIRSFVALCWNVYELLTPEADRAALLQTCFAHKATIVERGGLEWWSRTCASDREASILVDPEAARMKKRVVYAYLGGGQMTVASASTVQCVVVRVKETQWGAIVLAVAAILSRCSPDLHTVTCHPELSGLAEDSIAKRDDQLFHGGEDTAEDDQGCVSDEVLRRYKAVTSEVWARLGVQRDFDATDPEATTEALHALFHRVVLRSRSSVAAAAAKHSWQ